jgi:hypothetical protein
MQPTPRRTLIATTLTIAAAILGILWRLAPLHLPRFAYKYGGSALWAIALYWLIATLLPRRKPLQVALIAALLAAALELSRLYHLPALDAFRLTLLGKLLLGRFFSPKNIAAYWLAILAAALLDHFTLPQRMLKLPASLPKPCAESPSSRSSHVPPSS